MADVEHSQLPTKEEILDFIEKLEDVTEEEKLKLKEGIIGGIPKMASNTVETMAGSSNLLQLAIVLILFLLIASIIGLIAFRLIMNEKKRDDKKRNREKDRKKKKKYAGDGKVKKINPKREIKRKN